jgi:hypothetical protein
MEPDALCLFPSGSIVSSVVDVSDLNLKSKPLLNGASFGSTESPAGGALWLAVSAEGDALASFVEMVAASVQANSAPEKIAVKRSVLDARCAQNCNGAMTIP